ncbi:hypothetical protein [Christiangramia sp. LLG6405-1]|uniref:hypothetical protein n=1 Tax=Christiangramia sp. LLG6405-1 TaxID=3160832 RepID=UPI00386BE448
MNKRLFGFSLSAILLFASCEKENNDEISGPEVQETFEVETSQSTLSNFLSFDNSGVVSISSVDDTRNQAINNLIAIEQIAEIEPPYLEGEILRATDVDFQNNFVYVAYTKEDDAYLGAMDIIDISDEHNPILVTRVLSPFADINAISIDGNQLYFTGAYFANEENPDRAFIAQATVNNGNFQKDNVAIKMNMTGYAGVEIMKTDNSLIALTGSNGVFGEYAINGNNEFTTLSETSISDLRSAAYNQNKLALLSGDEGVKIFSQTGDKFELVNSFATSTLTPESKRKIAWFQDDLIVPEGAEGARIYNMNSSSPIKTLPIHSIAANDGIDEEDKATIAVSVIEDYIFTANGGAGLGVIQLSNDTEIIAQGIAEIDGSSNYVGSKGDYVFVASGEGLKILKLSKPKNNTGVSEYFSMCSDYPAYNGNPNLNVNSNEEKAYSGSASLNHLNINAKLTFCGSLNVKHGVNINSNAKFNMSGSLAIGRMNKREDLNINSNSVLRINGSVVIYSDLNLNSGSTIEFVGEDSSIHIYGNVRKGNNVTIKGTYNDTSNKL